MKKKIHHFLYSWEYRSFYNNYPGYDQKDSFTFRKKLKMFTQEQKKLLLLSSLGGALEFYDFIIYAVLANYLAKLFFNTGNSLTSLMATFATFSLGYLVRPLGGIICGHLGDRFGRKKVFTLSILLMALSTFAIGFIPSYAAIGILAPIILVILRIFQGFSVGGEIPGAIVYVTETIPDKKSLATGIVFGFLILGISLGLLTQAVLSMLLTSSQMLAWGWRIPFFIGGIFGVCSFFLRKNLEESKLFQEIEHEIENFPIIKVFQQRFINTLSGIIIASSGAALITLLFLFTPSYISNILQVHSKLFPWLNSLAMLGVSVLSIIYGFFGDHVNKKFLFTFVATLSIILAYPIFYFYSQKFDYFWLSLIFSALLTGGAWGIIPSMLSELFPTKIRFSGIALTYNLGFAIFGGLTPLISVTLIYLTGSNAAPFLYLIFIMIFSLIAIQFTRHKLLHHQ